MKVSSYFIPTLREDPAEATVLSHRLMLRSGMIYQTANGIYTWLPLGLRVLQKVENIIADEQNKAGGARLLMPTIQPATLWQESGRYDDYGKEMLRIKDRHDRDMLYGPTHEEVITDIGRQFLKSYRQLPAFFYQISWKFRDEIRPRFGVMRCREFLMEDGYTFDKTKDGAVQAYQRIVLSYLRVFARLSLRVIPVRASAGAIGGNMSHEFHVMAETGESAVYYDAVYDSLNMQEITFEQIDQIYTAADEKHDAAQCPVPAERLCSARGIEVGHVFYFGTKYSKAMGLSLIGPDGQAFYPEMGSYGIGVSRLIAAIIEASHDDAGIIWPESVAPFQLGIIVAKKDDQTGIEIAESIHQKLTNQGFEVLYDDREERAGVKFSDMDLIGLPHQLIIGSQIKDGLVEWKNRKTGERTNIPVTQIEEWAHQTLYKAGTAC